ncbi:MAG: polysaccharide pyruvyl transferase family protein [Paracoccaceae bacterium]
MSSPLTIGLLWHSANSDNLGVGALTVAQIAIVEGIAAELGREVRFLTLGWRDPRPSYVTADNVENANFRTRDLYRPSGLARSVRRCDIVLDIGAGDSFSDIYGAKRFIKYMTAKATVLALGRPLILSPQTIGPFKAGWARRVAFVTMRRAAAIFARDEKSIAILRDQGFGGDVHLASDVALRLPYDAPAARADDGPVRVGINVSGLLMNGGYTGANMFGLKGDYPAMMTRIVTRFAQMEGVVVHLVPHVIADTMPVEDDYRASETLARDVGQGVKMAPKFTSPSEAKTYIAGMDFFMGARMHACIAAFSSGVPVVPMAYSRKFAGLFGALEYPHTVDCTSDPAEEIEARIFEQFEARAALANETQAAFARGLDRLSAYEDSLRQIMST